jgi:hypothetical protein
MFLLVNGLLKGLHIFLYDIFNSVFKYNKTTTKLSASKNGNGILRACLVKTHYKSKHNMLSTHIFYKCSFGAYKSLQNK